MASDSTATKALITNSTTISLAPPDGNSSVTGTPGSGSDTGTTTSAPPTLPKPSYGSIVLTLDNVLLPPEKTNPSPSALDGLDNETEIFLRVAGCELIQTSGILLRLPQTAMATGQVLFQRFYYSKSFVRQSMETTAMACIYLASKIEEAPRRIRDVINVFHHIRQYRAKKAVIQPLILDQAYIRLKSDVTLAERRVLKELGFCVHVKHPHKIIVIYLQQLGYDQNTNFVQMSWNFMNDALRTNVFVRFKPEAIACACIFLSARKLKIPLPINPAWYLVFDVTDDEVAEIADVIMQLYERPPVDYDDLEKKVDVLAKAYQEIRQKGRASLLVKNDNSALAGTSDTQSPDSRPGSPNRLKPNTTEPAVVTEAKETEHMNGTNEKKANVKENRELSPSRSATKPKPSPIIFNNEDPHSPSHQKHKKRKKSRYSSSRSRSRSPRRSSKKNSYHNDDRSPSRKHHKKKSHQRYNSRSPSPRSRSRSRGRDGDRSRSSKKSSHRRGDYDYRDRDRSRSPIGSSSYYSPSRKYHSKKKSYYYD